MLCVLQSEHHLRALWYELCAFSFYLCSPAGPELGLRLMRNGRMSLGKRLAQCCTRHKLPHAQLPVVSLACAQLFNC